MRITNIEVENFLGIRAAHVALERPVALFAGANAAGKSSLQEAVRMALTGECVRVNLKKELPLIVTAGAREGYAQVVMQRPGGGEASGMVLLPEGKPRNMDYSPPEALAYVLDAQRFAHLDDKTRRGFLFGLMGLKTDLASVKERLLKKSADAKRVEAIVPMLRAGFDAASKAAKTKATEAKGAWRAATGETYGAVKAESWAAEKPDFDSAALKRARDALAGADASIAEANQALGALSARKDQHAQEEQRLTALRAKAANLARLRTKLQHDEGELTKAQQALDDAGGAPAAPALTCPDCAARLVLKDGALVHAAEPAGKATSPARLQQLTSARDLMQNAVNNTRRDLQEAERAEADIKAISEGRSQPPADAEITAAQGKVRELQQRRAEHESNAEALEKAAEAAEAAEELTATARAHHEDVAAWDLIGDALAPDGIPSEMLAEALEPINDRLAQSALDAEWPKVEITKDMEITADGRGYRLLSESEKWRVDAMLAEAISFQSGLKLLVLDRFDVLDAKGRTDLLAWLDVLASNAEIETALVFGTLKALPADLPATVAGEWIENGHVGQLKEAA